MSDNKENVVEEEIKTDDAEDIAEDIGNGAESEAEAEEKSDGKGFFAKKKANAEIKKLTAAVEEKENQIAELRDKYTRLAAEYDNYKRRTLKELDARYSDAKFDVLKSILPVIDNFERALSTFSDDDPQKQGVTMIYEQFKSILTANGVYEIEALGVEFDPNVHNAVMHVEDPELGENIIAEVFEKGYKTDDKVLRYSMVKVAN
ncbi:MAG: nucleotide exchange factor GrpE [Ruminococcaceae bacterium]|nr:nucleotide exchange factor GrpE [Oscillospiraceae bacterium]